MNKTHYLCQLKRGSRHNISLAMTMNERDRQPESQIISMCACICLDAVGIGFAFGCFFNLTKKSIETETDR